ncbi:HEPN domain-containing protein [Candidatus Bipolaricaulota bacterium]|nr:HEPN domain-containing protein [Candidatus Bipolaricaulota bacterium]
MSLASGIEALLAKAKRFIQSAKMLRDVGDMESAVSRLYYAMFFCAEALLLSKGLSFSRHGSVIAAFGEHFVKSGFLPAEMHRWLRDAFDKRQLANYEPSPVFAKEDVEKLLTQAENFLRETTRLLEERGGL